MSDANFTAEELIHTIHESLNQLNKQEMFTNAQVRILETIAMSLGARDEQERIIKLLEDEYERGSYEMGIVPHLIALIKVEQK